MNARSLSAERRNGVLHITFDTPACPVNIFSHQTGLELLSILDGVDEGVRAVVVRSAKPDSFINGASLMLASAVSSEEDLPRLTATIRKAYRAMGALKIPTIAAIRGNCYGCGVEFVLRFRYRIAADAYDTHFYMTEIADYLLVPTFGSTQYLPHMLGMADATDFLLWGKRWSGRDAAARGLVHGCFPDAEFDDAVERIAQEVALTGQSGLLRPPGPRPAEDLDARAVETRARIARLPPSYRPVYTTCYDLMEHAARKADVDDSDLEGEVRASGRSISNPMSKAAVALFFMRQLSEQVCLRGAPERAAFRLATEGDAGDFLRRELEGRRIRGVSFEGVPERAVEGASGAPVGDALRVTAYRGAPGPSSGRSGEAGGVAMSVDVEVAAPACTELPVLYAPSWRHGVPFVEIACPRIAGAAQAAFQLLAKAGVRAIVTCPTRSFVLNDLLRSYLAPQIAFLAGGGDRKVLAATLLEFGFTRLAGDWLPGWDLDRLAALCAGDSCATRTREHLARLPSVHDAAGGAPSEALVRAVLLSLLAHAVRNLEDKAVSHPSMVDVATREVLDFPLGRGSLCRHLTLTRARSLLDGAEALEHLVTTESLATARRHAEHGRDFYR